MAYHWGIPTGLIQAKPSLPAFIEIVCEPLPAFRTFFKKLARKLEGAGRKTSNKRNPYKGTLRLLVGRARQLFP